MNPAIASATPSLIRALHARRRPTSINLGIGEPTLRPDMGHFERATAWVAEHGCRYSTNIGDEDLRAAIARRYAYPGLDDPENVVVTNGSQEAVYVALRAVLDPALDELLIVDPSFPVYAKIAQVEGIPVRRVTIDPRGADAFDPDTILAAVGPRTRAIVICSPCNPTGRVISRESARRISEGLLARGGPPIYVMHDEIYREIRFTDDLGEFGAVYPHTIAINSLSKSNALTGMRVGWAIAPTAVVPALVKMHGWTTSCANTYAQRIAFDVLATDALGGHRAWYARQRRGVVATLAELGLEFVDPEGAFYVCVRVGSEANTLGFAEALLEESDVIAIPGDLFSPMLAGWLRTSFVGALDDVREGLRRIAAFSRAGGVALR